MPSCFQLFRKSKPDEAVKFVEIDKEICEHFKVECDPKWWYLGWYDYIGFGLATGSTYEALKKDSTEAGDRAKANGDEEGVEHWSKMLEVIAYLEERFTHKSWYEVKAG